MLWQPSIVHFCWRGNECLPFKHEKQSWFSAEILARCVVVFSLKGWHRRMGCWHLQKAQGNWSCFALWEVLLEICCFAFALTADFRGNFSFCYTYVTIILIFTLKEIALMRSWAFAFSFSQSLKSNMVGLNHSFFTVCIDQDSFQLGASFRNAWFKKDELRRSVSYDNDLNKPMRPVTTVANLIILSELCIFTGG